jgi:hypothetical protein
MQKVEGSNPFIRSMFSAVLSLEEDRTAWVRAVCPQGDVAEWLGTGLQNPLHRFNSGRRLFRTSLQYPCFCAPIGTAKNRVFAYLVTIWRPLSALGLTGGRCGGNGCHLKLM